MRALARRLGVQPNALYSHVAGKDELVDDLIDETLAAVAAPTAAEPVEGLREVMTSTYRVLLGHPDLVPLYLQRQGARGAEAERLGKIVVELLAELGVEGGQALEARRVLIVYTIGFAAFTVQRELAPPLPATFSVGLDWLLTGVAGGLRRRGAP